MVGAYDLLRRAILERKQVIAVYDGKLREMCPHSLGHKNGNARCLFYQFAGDSKGQIYSQNDPRANLNWRCMEVDKLQSVTLRDGPWHSISKHPGHQTCVDEVDVQVEDWIA